LVDTLAVAHHLVHLAAAAAFQKACQAELVVVVASFRLVDQVEVEAVMMPHQLSVQQRKACEADCAFGLGSGRQAVALQHYRAAPLWCPF
jgi:hypothetical protein